MNSIRIKDVNLLPKARIQLLPDNIQYYHMELSQLKKAYLIKTRKKLTPSSHI